MMKRVWRFLKLAIFSLIVVLIALAGVLPIGAAYVYIDAMVNAECGNRPEPLSQRLSQPDKLEALTFSPEGEDFVLDAWIASGSNGAGIIILPGAFGGADTMYQEMEFLHQAGYTVMTYDTRSCANPSQMTSLGYTEIADLQAALDIMGKRPDVDPNRIGVFGYSMGGATSIMTTARDERIKALVTVGGYADLADDIRGNSSNLVERWMRGWIERFYEWRTDVDIDMASPINDIAAISPRPVFLIHGSRELVNTRGTEQYEAAREPKQLWIVEGAGHGAYASVDFEGYPSRIIAFFDTYLK
jgi:uncharacterized protein